MNNMTQAMFLDCLALAEQSQSSNMSEPAKRAARGLLAIVTVLDVTASRAEFDKLVHLAVYAHRNIDDNASRHACADPDCAFAGFPLDSNGDC